MANKGTQIEKAIASLEADIAVLQAAINKLREQQKTAPRKRTGKDKPRIAAVGEAS